MHIVLWLHRNLLEYHVKIYSLYLPDFKTLQWNMKKMLWLKFVHSYCEHISNKTNTQHVHACKHTPINKKWWGFPIVHFIITELLTHNCHIKNETTDLYLYSNNSLFRESRNKDSMKQCDIFFMDTMVAGGFSWDLNLQPFGYHQPNYQPTSHITSYYIN